MKGLKAIFLCFIVMAAMMCTGVAAEIVLTPDKIVDKSAGVVAGAQIRTLMHGEYVAFDVDLTGMHSITMQVEASLSGNYDGDIYEIRLGSPKGTCISRINVNSEDTEYFTSHMVAQSGVKRVYIKSLAGLEDGCIFKSIKFSSDVYVDEVYQPTPQNKIEDYYTDTWSGYDGLGNRLADYEEVGDVKANKTVGMFYWTWHASFSGGTIVNVSEFIDDYPEARFDYNHARWSGTLAVNYFWNKPIWGYYTGMDEWVIRRHIEMFNAAGVDVLFFDCTNGQIAWKKGYNQLLSVMHKMREEGMDTPQVAFISTFGPVQDSKRFAQHVYYDLYAPGRYKDLWFYWNGKPLILMNEEVLSPVAGDDTDLLTCTQIRQFFTFRAPQANYTTGATKSNQWGWLEVYPQNLYSGEQMTVGTAVNHSYVSNQITAMNDHNSMGRSYTKTFTDDNRLGASKFGYFFTEQWRHALNVNPAIVFVTGWNEWTAGRHEEWCGITNAFPDQFDNEASRDIEPTADPDMQDFYYYHLADYVRKYKGVRPAPALSDPKTIDPTDISDWDDVSPTYYNFKNGPDRNCIGYGDENYVNTTCRNNIIRSKVARDRENIYFMAETLEPLSPYTDPDWMRLFINTDRNYNTGWQGFDYIINRRSPYETQTRLEAHRNTGWDWGYVDLVDYYIVDKKYLVIVIPQKLLGLSEPFDFEFKWADNTAEDAVDSALWANDMDNGIMMQFWSQGDTAPIGRYTYRVVTNTPTTVDSATRQNLPGAVGVYCGSSKAYVQGAEMPLSDKNTNLVAILHNYEVYIPYDIVPWALNTKAWWDAGSQNLVIQGQHYTISMYVNNSRQTTRNGVAFPTSPLIIHADHPYIPVSALISAYGLKSTNLGDANYMMFSTNDIVQIAAGQIRDKLIESKSRQGINGGVWLGNTVEANFIANNAPHHYEWVTSKFPSGPWLSNDWSNSKTHVIDELDAGQYVKCMIYDTATKGYSSLIYKDKSTPTNIFYQDNSKIEITAGTNKTYKPDKIPTSGRWLVSYDYHRTKDAKGIDFQTFDGSNNHFVFSFNEDLANTYTWSSYTSGLHIVERALPDADRTHTITFLFDFDQKTCSMSVDGMRVYNNVSYPGDFNGFKFNVYSGKVTVSNIRIYQMTANTAPNIKTAYLNMTENGVLEAKHDIYDYEGDSYSIKYIWEDSDKLNGEYTTLEETTSNIFARLDDTVSNKYVRVSIVATDKRGAVSEIYSTKPLKQPLLGDMVSNEEFHIVPKDISYHITGASLARTERGSICVERNNTDDITAFTKTFTNASGKLVFETRFLRSDLDTIKLILNGSDGTTTGKIAEVRFTKSATMLYYCTENGTNGTRFFPKNKAANNVWYTVTFVLDTTTNRFSFGMDGETLLSNLRFHCNISDLTLTQITEAEYTFDGVVGTGNVDYIRLFASEKPEFFTEIVDENGEPTDENGSDTFTVNVDAKNPEFIAVAIYQEGRLVKIISGKEALNTTFTKNGEETEVRFFSWGEAGSLIPKENMVFGN